jgi:hypothetical protein
MTLLQIVNRTLSAINSTDVASVADTEEAGQVVDLVHLILEELYGDYPWLHKKARDTPDAGATTNDLAVPADWAGIEWIYYNGSTDPKLKLVSYVEPAFMQNLLYDRINSGASNVDANGALNDTDPKYWTSFDQDSLIFDSYPTTLTNTKALCYVTKIPVLPTLDANTPDMPTTFHYVVLYGTLMEAFRTIKGDDDAADRYVERYKRGQIAMKRYADVVQIPQHLRQPTWQRNYARIVPNTHRNDKLIVEAP